jgi:hypothetical protein
MTKSKKIASFFDHFPPEVAEYCFQLWEDHPFEFIVSKARNTKLGDFRFSPTKGYQVTVNHNLNPYAFLVTYIHEVAHRVTFDIHKNKVSPHGIEWKRNFLELFEPILDEELLPPNLVRELKEYLRNPAATSNGYAPLVAILSTFDSQATEGIRLVELEEGRVFQLKNLILIKGKLRRTRYICQDTQSSKNYLVAKNAYVQPQEPLV